MSPSNAAGWTEVLGEHAANPQTPRTSGETILALGKEWKFSSLEARIKAQFEQWVRSGARIAIKEAELEGDMEEADKLRRAYQADLGAGHYKWDGRNVRSARGDIPGLKHLIFLLLRRCHPEITEETVDQIFKEAPRDCGVALAWASGKST
ncbi:MAG: hypothetical protein KGL39_40670 [Patescibacteria group bacterium]|nr:hypothetical protein [Patescibacteria group bacterium]